MTQPNPFRYFRTSPEIIRLAVMMYVRFPLSLRNVENLLHERDIEVSHETVRFWWQRSSPRPHTAHGQRHPVWPKQPRNRTIILSRQSRFDIIGEADGIELRLTKPNHLWREEDQSSG